MTRIKRILSAAAFTAALSAGAAYAQQGLKDVYANHFRVGNILNSGTVNNSGIRTLVAREYNSISMENEMKPDATMSRNGSNAQTGYVQAQLNTGARNILRFCEDNNIPVRGHVLVWHGQTPHWFFTADMSTPSDPGLTPSVNWASRAQMEARLESYINNLFDLIKKDFPNVNLYAYDVVNEAVGECNSRWGARCPGYDFRGAGGVGSSNSGNSPWVQIYGDNSFIESAFAKAAVARDRYFPNMKLFYNDYNEWQQPKRDHIISNILRPLREKGILDGMGMQHHVNADFGGWSSVASCTTAMNMYAALDIEVQLTELEVSLDRGSGQPKWSLQQQADRYKNIFEHAIRLNQRTKNAGRPGVTAICIWTPNDANTWIGSENAPALHNAQNQEKLAYTAVKGLVPQSQWGDGNNPPCCIGGGIAPNTPGYCRVGNTCSETTYGQCTGTFSTTNACPIVCPNPPPAATTGNLVTDGIFSGPSLGQWAFTNISDGAAASAEVRCNEVTIDITSVGAEGYQPQLVQQGIRLEQGKAYRLTFDASSVGGTRTIDAQIERLGGDGVEWGHMYGQRTFTLTTGGNTHTFEFDMTDPTDLNVQLAFNFGVGQNATRNVTIRNVRLVEAGDIVVPCNALPPTAGNLVANGVFSGGELSPWSLANASGGAVAEASLGCNSVTIHISSAGAEIYQPQLIQQGITLEHGKAYELTFTASAVGDRTIDVQLERRGDADKGWEWGYMYNSQTFNLTSDSGQYKLQIEMTDPTDDNVQLAFNFGGLVLGATHNVTINNVRLVETGTTSVSPKQTAPAKKPLMTVRGRTLNVNAAPDSKMKVRVVDMRGKTAARFNTMGSAKLSLTKLPAGRYFVEIKGAGVKNTIPTVLK
ncbi:MAG: endo-1,4-beta-xylanase [Chitinispirillales bacterium]|jgi:GH35 family endo-1,4-beta-xylanase|nr:endo-1,4-beta-xylanase [Chitinispirillales bacterium]